MKTGRVLLLCSVAALCACHRDSAPAPAPVAPVHKALPLPAKKGPTAAELTRGMVEAATQGNADLQIQMKFDLPQRPTTGQLLTINVALLPQVDGGPVTIEVAGGDGLSVAPGSTPIELPAVQTGEAYRQAIKVTPSVDGVLLLSLKVSFRHEDVTDSRVFSIPLIAQH